MANLGDKEIDFNFYGINYRNFTLTKNGTPENNPVATLVQRDTWDGYYMDISTYPYTEITAMKGKPLNDSIALWKVPENCSFNPATICIKNSSILNVECKCNTDVAPTPLAMQITNVSSYDNPAFSTNPPNRLAYDQTSRKGWERSALVSDISYTSHCFASAITCFDSSDNSASTQSLGSLAAYIDSNPEKRSAMYIRPILYYGTEIPRILGNTTNAQYIPETDGSISREGTPVLDILTDRQIPDNATAIKTLIRDNHSDWEDTKIYAPFGFNPAFAWFATETGNTDHVHRIGYNETLTVNNVINGIGSPAKERGRFFRCNFEEKVFDDVSYKWELCCYHANTNRYLDNGFDLTLLTGSSNLRFFTKLVVTDRKGATLGQAVTNAVMHELAYIGLYFCKTIAIAENRNFLTESLTDVFCPVFKDGVTTGEYKTGDEIKTLPNWNSNSVGDEVFKYVPDITEEGDFNSITNTGTIGAGVQYYALDNTQVNALCTWLNTTYNPTDETQFIQDFKGQNPGDYITTMMFYPFDIPLDAGVDVPITIGKLASGTSGRKLDYTYGDMYEFGSYTFPKYGDFRDYLMKISVYLPFCGRAELDPRLWAGREITIKMSIDFPTGACTAYLYRTALNGDKFIMQTLSGTIGVPLPLSAVANGSYQVAITNLLAQGQKANQSIFTSTVSAAAGVASVIAGSYTGNYKLALGGLATAFAGNQAANQAADTLENVAYNIDHTAPTVGEIQGGSPFLNCGSDYRVSIFICTPKLLPSYNASAYGRTTGYACCKQGKLSEVAKGFTRCAGADLTGIACTSSERKMIFESLQTGVIV